MPTTHTEPATPAPAVRRLCWYRRPGGRGFLLLWTLCLLSGCAFLDPRQKDPPPPGVAEEGTLCVDGLPERLLIRGSDPAHNPVLLFVHGGPGFPAAPFRQVNSDLERYFTVVHWDQRGTGYSYRPDLPPDTLRVEQFVRETLQVTHALCRKFGQRRLYLVGHSWGTLPALLAAEREPQCFHAYIALSQLVDVHESEHRLTEAAFRHAHANDDPARARALRSVGPPPYRDLPDLDRASSLVTGLFPRVPNQATAFRLALLALSSRYYPLDALFRVNAGYRFSRRIILPQLSAYDLRRDVPRVGMPVYFFVGREDSTFGVSLQREYYERLAAPRGKTFVLFSKSTHWPHLEQPREFLRQMLLVRAQTWR